MVLLDVVPGTLFLKNLDSNRHSAIPADIVEVVPGTDSRKQGLESGFHSYKAVNAIAKTLKDVVIPVGESASGMDVDEQALGDLYCVHETGGSR